MTTHPTVTGSRRSLVLPPAWQGQESAFELAHLAAIGARARTDYVELARALDADVMDWQYFQDQATPIARAVARRGFVPAQLVEGSRAAIATATWWRRRILGLPLALLFKIARSRRDLALISVWLSKSKKAVFTSSRRTLPPEGDHLREQRDGDCRGAARGPKRELHFRLQRRGRAILATAGHARGGHDLLGRRLSRATMPRWSRRSGNPTSRRKVAGHRPRTGDVSADLSSAFARSQPATRRSACASSSTTRRAAGCTPGRASWSCPGGRRVRRRVTVIAEAMAMGKAVVVPAPAGAPRPRGGDGTACATARPTGAAGRHRVPAGRPGCRRADGSCRSPGRRSA